VVVDDGDVEGVTETSVCEEEGVYVMIHDGEHDDDVEEVAIIIFNVVVVAVTYECMYVCKQTTTKTLQTVCKITSLHFTSLHFTSLHFTSLHFTSLHFTSLAVQEE